MLVYSVTETVDIASRVHSTCIVVLEICLPPNTEAAPPLTYNPGYVPALA